MSYIGTDPGFQTVFGKAADDMGFDHVFDSLECEEDDSLIEMVLAEEADQFDTTLGENDKNVSDLEDELEADEYEASVAASIDNDGFDLDYRSGSYNAEKDLNNITGAIGRTARSGEKMIQSLEPQNESDEFDDDEDLESVEHVYDLDVDADPDFDGVDDDIEFDPDIEEMEDDDELELEESGKDDDSDDEELEDVDETYLGLYEDTDLDLESGKCSKGSDDDDDEPVDESGKDEDDDFDMDDLDEAYLGIDEEGELDEVEDADIDAVDNDDDGEMSDAEIEDLLNAGGDDDLIDSLL